jgi:hypothetical protein
MKSKFFKTDHFKYRQWDRGIDDKIVEKAMESITGQQKCKSLIILGADTLKSTGVKNKKHKNLVLVAKGRNLLTLFYVNDLYSYLKSVRGEVITNIV